jgi:ribosomal protein S18 acetylase RimI-like enzyme
MSAMATTDGLSIRALGVADLPAAQRLSDGAGWNQVEADWRIFLELGRLYGAQGPDGRLLATGATLPLGHALGWISMVIVTPTARHLGIGRRVVLHCLEDLTGQGLVPGLDATPDGREVYGRLGFRDAWPITRFVRPGTGGPMRDAGPMAPEIRIANLSDLGALAELDARAFGTDRRAVLARLIERAPALAVVGWTPESAGFLLGRVGRAATHLGPLVASHPALALAMVDHAIACAPGPLVIDLVDLRPGLRAALEERGFAQQRRFTRMYYRRSEPFGDPNFAIAVAGPELG